MSHFCCCSVLVVNCATCRRELDRICRFRSWHHGVHLIRCTAGMISVRHCKLIVLRLSSTSNSSRYILFVGSFCHRNPCHVSWLILLAHSLSLNVARMLSFCK